MTAGLLKKFSNITDTESVRVHPLLLYSILGLELLVPHSGHASSNAYLLKVRNCFVNSIGRPANKPGPTAKKEDPSVSLDFEINLGPVTQIVDQRTELWPELHLSKNNEPGEVRALSDSVKLNGIDPSRVGYIIDLKSASLVHAVDTATEAITQETQVQPHSVSISDQSTRIRIYQAFMDLVVDHFESERSGIYNGTYDSLRNSIRENPKIKDKFGTVLDQKGAVCEELSLLAHIVFSRFGIPTKFQRLTIPGAGGHAVLTAEGGAYILDFNYRKGVHTKENYFLSTRAAELGRPTFFYLPKD